MKKNLSILLSVLLYQLMAAQSTIDVQGHRGCRGIMPENTLAAFIKAVDLGVNTLEMDVVITKDNQVLVSHEAYLNHEICYGPHGEEITKKTEQSYNLYKMDYVEIKQCDCGSKPHPRYKEQQKLKAYKPLLEDVIDTIEKYTTSKKIPPVKYNIEIKSEPKTDNEFHPAIDKYTDMVYTLVKDKQVLDRVILQSFDIRVLQYIHKQNYPVKLSCLVENTQGLDANLDLLGFMPDIYSPYYKLLSENDINKCHQKNIQVMVWTVNRPADIEHMLKIHVDGIISDYPDKVIAIVNKK
jgi:glycerophosphoryl diester phosphodiesterase